MNKLQKRVLLGVAVFFVFVAAGGVVVLNRQTITQWFAPKFGATAASGDTQPIVDAFNKNDFAGAVAQADAQLAADPNNIRALLLKAGTLAQQGSLTFNERTYALQAIDIAHQVLALDPKNDEAWRIIGYANEIMQHYGEAHAAYNQSLAFNPHNVMTLFDNAHAWDLQGKLDQAETGYRAALALAPDLDQAHMGLGRVLTAKGDTDGAISQFTQAAASTKNVRLRAEATYSAGILIQSRGDTKTAEQYMRNATTIDPSYPLGWAGLGTVLFTKAMSTSSPMNETDQQAAVQESLTDLDKAIKLNPNQTVAHIQFATEFALIGHADDAINILEKTKRIVPGDITLNATDKAATLQHINAVENNIKALKQVGY